MASSLFGRFQPKAASRPVLRRNDFPQQTHKSGLYWLAVVDARNRPAPVVPASERGAFSSAAIDAYWRPGMIDQPKLSNGSASSAVTEEWLDIPRSTADDLPAAERSRAAAVLLDFFAD